MYNPSGRRFRMSILGCDSRIKSAAGKIWRSRSIRAAFSRAVRWNSRGRSFTKSENENATFHSYWLNACRGGVSIECLAINRVKEGLCRICKLRVY